MITVTLSDWQLLVVLLAAVGAISFGMWRLVTWVEVRYIAPWTYRRLAKRWGMQEEEVRRLFEENKLRRSRR